MTSIARRPLLLGAAAAALGLTGQALGAQPARAAGSPPSQLAFLNHTYTVLDPETADAVATNDYLHEFGAFQLRTTTNGDQTYSGRYLLGRETYLEMFAAGELPAPDDERGASGLALSPDREGGIVTIRQRLVDAGVTAPLDLVQTKEVDGAQLPWFRVVSPVTSYSATFPWVMEYLASWFADPRTHSEPATFAGDVSRERYNPDDYRQHLMRDVVGVELALPPQDVAGTVLTLRSSGYDVRTRGTHTVATGRGSVIVLDAVPRASAGWRRIVFALSASPRSRCTERIGRSTLVVGPGPQAVWTFDPPR